jgi:hypothetical protein
MRPKIILFLYKKGAKFFVDSRINSTQVLEALDHKAEDRYSEKEVEAAR